MSSTASGSARPRRGGLPVAVVILAALIVPLAMSLIMLTERISETRSAQANLEVLRTSGSNYAGISQARAALAQERLATSAVLALESYNIDPGLATQITGVDVQATAAESVETVDALLQQIDPTLADSPAISGRQDADGSIFRYYPLMEAADQVLAERQAAEREQLRAAIVRFDGVAGLAQLADQLEVATKAQLSTARLADTYLALKLQLDGWEPTDEAIRFQTAWFNFLGAESDLDPEYRRSLEANPSAEALRARFEEAVVGVADAGSESVALPVGENLFEGLIPLQSYFREFVTGYEGYASVSTETADRFQATADLAEGHLQSEISVSYAAVTFLVVALIGGLWFTSRQVVIPLRRLAPQIRRFRQGRSDVDIETAGALEIQEAAVAINDAAATMAEVERQSRVLASGSLTELAELAPSDETEGAMGASVRRSLEELSAVMREREELRQQLEHAAFHDVLTGLANRRGFRIQLDKALEVAADAEGDAGAMTALYLDLDRFKSVNDSYGHAAGDALLTEVADRLRSSVRENDVIGRMGGDEFLIVVFDNAERSGRSLASAVKSVVEVPYRLDDKTFNVGASVGFHTASLSTPIDLLIRCADAAAYYAKAHLSPDPVAYTESIGEWMDSKSQTAPTG